MGDNLKGKMLAAVKWSSVDRFGQQSVQFIIAIILTRLLTPEDFGLLGLIMIFAALSFVLVESGFGQALIRKEDVNELDYSSVFYFNVSISAILYLTLYFLSPLIANFFDQPQLIYINRVAFVAILFNAFYLIPLAKLGKALDFKTMAKVNLLSTGLSGMIGVGYAFWQPSVWALVLQQVSYHFFRMLFFYVFVQWKPKLLFSFRVIRSLLAYSVNLLLTSLLNVLFNYIFVIILGRFYSKADVGYYSQGNKLSETFNFTFQSILVGSSFSLFSQIQHDEDRFRRVFREIANKASIVTFPVVMVLIVVAQPLIEVLWTTAFLPSVPYFRILCLASLFMPLYTLNISALNAQGQSKTTFKIELIKKAFILTGIFLTFKYGVFAMLWTYAFSSITAYAISVLYLKKQLNHYIKHQFLDFVKSLGLGLFIALVVSVLGLFIVQAHWLLASQLLTAAVSYVLVIKFLHPDLYRKVYTLIGHNINLLIKK